MASVWPHFLPSGRCYWYGRKDLKFRPSKEAGDQVWFSTDSLHRLPYFVRQMWDIEAAHMAELVPLQLLPEPFAGGQLGGIGWQALQMQALCRATCQELLDG